jgi:hypothetical protein
MRQIENMERDPIFDSIGSCMTGGRPMTAPQYRTALIVGAGEGLSASLARLLAKAGLRVAVAARRIDKLAALSRELGSPAFACDAADADQVSRLFVDMEKQVGAPDVVVYNASARSRGPLVDLVPADVQHALTVSAFGGFLVAQQAARRMVPNRHGAIFAASPKAWRASSRRKASMWRISSSTERSEILAEPSHPTSPTRCSTRMRLPKVTCRSCDSHAALGRGKSSCGRGSSVSDMRAVKRALAA